MANSKAKGGKLVELVFKNLGLVFSILRCVKPNVVFKGNALITRYEDVTEVLLHRFWEPAFGATSEEYSADWQTISDYRGQNSNMHLTEALMAAYEVTDNQMYLNMAESSAELIIDRHARNQNFNSGSI